MMLLRHLVAILAAIQHAQYPDGDADEAIQQAIACALGGMGEREIVGAIETITRRADGAEIVRQVEIALAFRAAAAREDGQRVD